MESPPPTLDISGQTDAVLSGRSISPGLGMGQAWIVADVLKWGGAATRVGADEVRRESLRVAESFEQTLAQLDQYARRIEAEFDATLAGIFRAHGEMLRELFESGEFEHELNASRVIAEEAVRRVLLRWYKKFEAIENPTLRQRTDDVLDLGRSMIRRLRGEHDSGFAAIPAHSVLVSERLLPSDVVSLSKSHVAAVVVEELGQGSHAALLLREKGIPAITEIPGVLSRIAVGAELLVDGYRGSLVIGPTVDAQAEFQTRVAKWRATLVHCKAACRDPACTLDGQVIRVEANIGLQDGVEVALENGADGVGLLRIEQLYFARPSPPTETPAAALEISDFARHVDFFCVGTNDLTQYTLAAARDDASVSDYYLDGHESIMRLLRIIVSEAAGRPVTVCGELAGREAYVPQLLQMGFRGLSVAPSIIPTTKALIRRLDLTNGKS